MPSCQQYLDLEVQGKGSRENYGKLPAWVVHGDAPLPSSSEQDTGLDPPRILQASVKGKLGFLSKNHTCSAPASFQLPHAYPSLGDTMDFQELVSFHLWENQAGRVTAVESGYHRL